VACKKFRVDRDFYSEADTLQILKESLVSQTHILKHLATIKHGPDCYILLPYASHGDLYQFLRCGRPVDDEPPPYNFGQKFPLISKTPKIAGPLLKQCWALANAVNWLHDGITIESNTNSSKVFCIHMDLKPDNILIQQDNQSIVGKWMISDFGISVTKEKRRENNPNIISIRDWYNKLTSVNTRPRRNVGTYQAPEVGSAENNQRGVGSRLDIWSYGCIFSEILAFAIGRDKEVERFNSERNNGKDNYFFDDGLLGGKAQVRQSVTDWLNARRDSSNIANEWERCWAETIKKILVIEPNERPNGKQLQKLIEHVKSHESMSAQEASKKTCHNLVVPRTLPQSRKDFKPPGPIITVSSPPGTPAPFPPESGIFINAHRKQDPQAHRHSPGGTAIDVALSHHDKKTRAAFLTKETVQVYDLDLDTYKVTPYKEYAVTSRLKNAHLTLSGPFLAVWGFCEQRKKKMV
jgi:serine/threonine protein kinase